MRRNSERILLLWLVGGIFHETLDTVWNTRRHSAVAPLCEVRWGFVQSWESCFNSASSLQNGHFRVTNKMKRIHTDRGCKLCSNLHPSEFRRNVRTTWFVSAKILTWNQQTVQGCLEINICKLLYLLAYVPTVTSKSCLVSASCSFTSAAILFIHHNLGGRTVAWKLSHFNKVN